MTGPRIDSKGRIVVPKEDRVAWQIEPGDAVHVRITEPEGHAQAVRDTIDSRGRVTISKKRRDALQLSEGDHVEVSVLGVQNGGYVCDDCGDSFDLGKMLIVESGERVVCAECSTPSDRIIT